ncbi:hypothetical protein LCGC14_1382110, partial [marine sediment metagenome]
MSLTDRDDYDALVRAAKQLLVYERLPFKQEIITERPGWGCFDCQHSVGSMSEGKKYSSVFFFPWMGASRYEAGTHLVYGQLPFPAFSVVISPEDKFYNSTQHFIMERVQSWDPPSSILVTRLDIYEQTHQDMYVRLLCTYDEGGESQGVRHINGRINILDDLVNQDDSDPGQYIVVSSSSYLRGTYVDLEIDFGVDGESDLEEVPLYGLKDMFMTDRAWSHASALYGAHLGIEKGPNLVQLKDPTKKPITKRKRRGSLTAILDENTGLPPSPI